MHMIPARALRSLVLITALGAPAIPAAAQYAITAADPGTSLAGALRILSGDPRNFLALIAAGRASLDMGDTQAAAGFYGRAEEAAPQSPVPKVGMAAALTAMGDARGAMTYFDRATALGAPQSLLALDRGLALDLLGQQPRAQADYRVAMFGTQADEARRRLALSQAISKDFRGAAATLQPLLARRDPGAIRTNAFVLALAGDRDGARRTIDSAQPGAGAQFEPFFRLLPGLRADEKAMAVHLGEFPKDAAQRYVAPQRMQSSPILTMVAPRSVTIPPPRRTVPVQITPPKNAPLKPPPAAAVASVVAAPVPTVSQVTPSPTRMAMAEPRPAPVQVPTVSTVVPPPSSVALVQPSPAPLQLTPAPPKLEAARTETPKTTQLAGDPRPGFSADELMPVAEEPEPLLPVNVGAVLNREGEPIVAARTETSPRPETTPEAAPPPAPKPKVEFVRPRAPKPKVELAKLELPKAKDQAKAKAKPKVEAEKPREVAKAKPPASPYFVQLASGANANRMAGEYIKIKAKKPGLFAGRNARVTNGKDLFRLVVGPFKSRDDSGAFVNQLSKAGIDGFTYTAPDGMTFEKIATK